MAKIDDSVKKKVPELRFKGFTDEWEQRKFDECFNFPVSTNSLSRALLNYDEGDIKSVHYGDILIKYPAILNIKNDKIPYITGGKLEKYKSSLLENGDLIFADAAEDETVGKAVEVNGLTEENLVAGLHTIVARSKDKKAEFFLGYYINSNTYHRQLLRLIQGSKVSSISKGNLQKTLVSFPKDFEEQQKIGSFFKQLDDTIVLHQRKLDLLKEQKKGYLQKMFPKNGEKVPELRFAGFADDWEERKLDTIFNKIRNAFVGTATPYYVDAGHFYLESNNIKNGQINRDTEVFINDEFYNKQTDKLLHTGDIVMVQSGHVGHTAVIPQELDGTAAHALIMFTDYKEKTDSFFLNYQFQTYKSKIKLDKITTGNTIKHILSSEMKEFFIDYPSYEEQQKIGSFFKQLDDTIALHQRKLDLLKEQKKGFLQKMFV
ncbi:restriction endonuclease subunit S [Lactococcus cremoris]|uniref:restriction endonuclease subunit S n=1 Tax=Lactococcus lactis subsp. cremoris TaxID=1359 RepID=UPI0037BF4848